MLDGQKSGRFGIGSILARTPLALPGQRVGLLGGSFNPAHNGHLQISKIAQRQLDLDQVWWLVSPGNPLKSNDGIPSTAARIARAKTLGLPNWLKVTDFEAKLGTSYTAKTLRFLSQRYPSVRFVWLMGADNLATFHRWHDWRGIAETIPIAIANRPGYRFQSVASPAAHAFKTNRIADARIRLLPGQRPPAWGFVQGPQSDASSTELRRKSQTSQRQAI